MSADRLQTVAWRAFPGPARANRHLRIAVYETAAAGAAAKWAIGALFWAKKLVWPQLLRVWPLPTSTEALLAVAEGSLKRAWTSCRKAREAIEEARLENEIACLDEGARVRFTSRRNTEERMALGG
jgi:hypothetical protein